jgi:hypothetical protein
MVYWYHIQVEWYVPWMTGMVPLVPWYCFQIEWYVPWMTGMISLVPWYCCKLMVCTMACWYCVQLNGTYHGIHYDTTVTDLAVSMEINATYLQPTST